MDKETIIGFCNNKNVNLGEALKVISEYCEEKNKKPEDIDKLIYTLRGLPPLIITDYLNTAIEYYKVKFNLVTIYKDNQELLTF